MTRAAGLAPRPYPLKNPIRHYDWGERGPSAFIAKLLGISDPKPIPYAELWVGAHPSAPSLIVRDEADFITLNDGVRLWPLQILGPRVSGTFKEQWPFLLKILSAAEALSIQAHPDRSLAPLLHAQNPDHYPDANHKPEIAVALGRFQAVAGFKPVDGWQAVLTAFPEIAAFMGCDIPALKAMMPKTASKAEAPPCVPDGCSAETFWQTPKASTLREAEESKEAPRSPSAADFVKNAFSRLLFRALKDPKGLADTIHATARRMGDAPEPFSAMADLFHELLAKYGPEDVGLLVLLFLNPVELLPGQAVFLPPGLPHAYLRGNIVECMANSDNVVRLGLTPKHKDFHAILQVLHFDPVLPPVMTPPEHTHTVYSAPCAEFQVHRWIIQAGQSLSMARSDGPEVILVIEGRGTIFWGGSDPPKEQRYDRGQSFLIPALLTDYGLEAQTRTLAFSVRVPP
ncbi:MAG: mannose-6-phosphate isomerase, class I [Desulfosoma sp.]